MNRISIGVFGFRASLAVTGRDEVTATLPHHRGAWDVITEAQPGTQAVIEVDGTEVPCTVIEADQDAWTVTVAVELS